MLYLLNTTVIPHGADGLWVMRTVTAEWAQAIAKAAAEVGQLRSAVGDSSSAEAMTAALGMPVACNRITVVPEPGDELLCMRLHSRPPESPAAVPEAWLYPDEPSFDGEEWNRGWCATTCEQVARWKTQPGSPIPLFRQSAALGVVPTLEATGYSWALLSYQG